MDGRLMFVFDGDCGFCSRYAYWIVGHLPSEIDVVPWQELDDLDAYGLTRQDVECAPLSLLSRVVYRWIAENRHRLPGATPAWEIEGRKRW